MGKQKEILEAGHDPQLLSQQGILLDAEVENETPQVRSQDQTTNKKKYVLPGSFRFNSRLVPDSYHDSNGVELCFSSVLVIEILGNSTYVCKAPMCLIGVLKKFDGQMNSYFSGVSCAHGKSVIHYTQ